MKKIYLLTVMGIFLLTSLSVRAFDMRSNQPLTSEIQGECDSLFITGIKGFAMLTKLSLAYVRLSAYDVQAKYHPAAAAPQECDSIYLSNGKAYAVKNLVMMEKEVSFQFCEDPENHPQTAPWQRIDHIKKADGTLIGSPYKRSIASTKVKKREYTTAEKEKKLEKDVNILIWLSIISGPLTFVGLGLLLGFGVILLGKSYRKKAIGHPKEKQLLKKIKLANRLTIAMYIIVSITSLILLILLIYSFLFPTYE